ncbi:MAG: ExbD/TolR family protein [Myxococcota bacterium]
MRKAALFLMLASACTPRAPARSPCPSEVATPAAAIPQTPSVSDLASACEQGGTEACETLSAMYRLGVGAPSDAERASSYGKRAFELRVGACARGEEAACEAIPEGLTPLALNPAVPPGNADGLDLPIVLVTLFADGKLLVDGSPVEGQLKAAVAAACGKGARAVLNADRNAVHGDVIRAVDSLKQAGCTRIAFGVSVR